MVKLTLTTVAVLVALSSYALAVNQAWNITEEGATGVKNAQGTWAISIDNDSKISGSANMQLSNGTPLTYTLDGSVKDSVYMITLAKRTDGKNGCVWSGHIPSGVDMKSHGLIGDVSCDGNVKFIIRAGF